MQIFSRPLSQVLVSFATAPIQEMFEEIIHDAFIEAFAEGFADIVGWSEDVGFWLSSLGTSYREVKGALGEIVLGKGRTDLKTTISVLKAKKAGDMNMIVELQQKINQDLLQRQELNLQKQQETNTWQKLLISNFFKGFLMLAPALFFGTFDLFALSGFKRTVGGIQSYVEYKSRAQAYKKERVQQSIGNIAPFYQNLQEQMKKPAGINEGALNTIFREMQETDIMNPPAVDISILFNPNPVGVGAREILVNRFKGLDSSVLPSRSDLIIDVQPMLSSKVRDVEINKESINRMPEWKQILHQELDKIGTFESLHPNREMTLKEFLTELNLYEIRHNFGVLINGKKVDSDYTIVTSTDEIVILPLFRGSAPIRDPRVNNIVAKISNIMASGKLTKSWQFLTEGERVYLLNYYDGLVDGLLDQNQWNPTQDSSYIPHTKFIIDELTILLFDLGVINKPIYGQVEGIVFSGTTTRFSHVIQRLKSTTGSESQFRIGEHTLDKWLIRIENEIHKKFSGIHEGVRKDGALYLVKDLFSSIYSLYGYKCENSFYREARLMLLRMGEFLRVKGIQGFSLNNFEDLESFIDRSTRYIYDNRKTALDSIPDIDSIVKLRDDIKASLQSKTQLSASDIDDIIRQIASIAQVYIDRIQHYLKGQDILKGVLDAPNKKLLQEIIHCPFLNTLERLQNRLDLSHLLFGDGKDQIDDFVRYDDKYLRSLLEIKFNVEQWTLKDFKELSIRITERQLKDLQIYIDNVIDQWIFNNPYSEFIKEDPFRFGVKHSKNFLKLEFEVVYNIYKAFRIHEMSQISFGKISESVKSSYSLTRKLRGKSANFNIGTKTLRLYLKTINDFKTQASSISEISIYDQTISIIKSYVAKRHLGFNIKSDSGIYNPIFSQDWYKSTLLILNLLKFGGIHPITFELLKPQLFDGNVNTGLYQSHHIDASMKHLLQCNEILILDPVWHARFNYLARTEVGIELQRRLRDGILKLMDIKRDISMKDIKEIFGDLTILNRKVVDWWIQNPDFNALLDKWNEDRILIRQGKIYEFIAKNFKLSDGSNPVLDRFWWNAKETINAFLLLNDEYDLSYLFTEKDKEFILQHFKLEDLDN